MFIEWEAKNSFNVKLCVLRFLFRYYIVNKIVKVASSTKKENSNPRPQ